MSKQKTFRFIGGFNIKDELNNLEGIVDIMPPFKKAGKLGRFFKSAVTPTAYQLNQITCKILNGKRLVSCGGGNYSSYLQIDGQVFWEHSDPIVEWKVEKEEQGKIVLPSSVIRMEVKQMIDEELWDLADKWISDQENQMWTDQKLRKSSKK